MRGLLLLSMVSLAALLTACRVGRNPARSPMARDPHGDTVFVRWGGPKGRLGLQGEFVALTDSGLVVDRGDSLFLVSFGTGATLEFAGPLGRVFARDEPSSRLTNEARLARHPYGLTPEQLDRLLALRGQERLANATGR